jgi:hypothetical protein
MARTYSAYIKFVWYLSHLKVAISIRHPAPQLLVPFLEEHDRTVESAKFSQTSYSCSVCLTSVKGARCIRLSCEHVFCRSCLGDFWSLFIKEGDVSRVGCPDPTCVKENRTASEEELRRVVTEKDITRWKWLVEKQMLEKGGLYHLSRSRLSAYVFVFFRSNDHSLPYSGLPKAGACS